MPSRVLPAGLALLLLSACVLPGQDGGGQGGAGGSGAGGGDDEPASECEGASSTCEDCARCASQGLCAQVISACRNDASCTAIDECLYVCGGDLECSEQCYYQAPDGVDLHNQAYACLYCDQCPGDCAGQVVCG